MEMQYHSVQIVKRIKLVSFNKTLTKKRKEKRLASKIAFVIGWQERRKREKQRAFKIAFVI